MYVKWVNVTGLPVGDESSGLRLMDCDKRINLLIGPNASGKSTILQAMKELLQGADFEVIWSDDEIIDTGGRERPVFVGYPAYVKEVSIGAISVGSDFPQDTHLSDVPFLYIPATRVNLPRIDISDGIIDGTIFDLFHSKRDPLERLFDTDSGVFYGHYMASAMDWLRQKMTPVQFSKDGADTRRQQEQYIRALELGYSCVKSICSEVIYGTFAHYIEIMWDEINPPKRIVHYNLGIDTTDNTSGEPLYAGALSSGTQGTLLWVWALAIKIAHHYDWQEGWQEKPAILLIDEIENHLHPTWQRRVIPALLEHFPGLQIFATTHSPFVVAGLKAGQVHLLNRDANGIVTATTNAKNIIGWTSDEILRTMMGVDDPTDDATAAAARELRQLRAEGPRDTEEAEEQRQQRMLELRGKVDRDLLAGGPMAAHRELFEQQFAEIIKGYRRSQELNQDNG